MSEIKQQYTEDEKRGLRFIEEGDKALQRFSWFGMTQGAKFDDAIAKYTRAANIFKMAESFELAAKSFEKVADISTQAKMSNFQVAQNYFLSGDSWKNVNKDKATDAYNFGIKLVVEEGRFGQGAKYSEQIGEMYEKEQDSSNAQIYFEQASKYFLADNSPTRSNKCLEKVAKIQAENVEDSDQLGKAASLFERLGDACLESNLLKFNARKHFFHCCLCHLARNDLVAVELKYEEFVQRDYSWKDSREGKLIESIISCLKDEDVDKFSDVLFAYDQISRLDPLQTSLLLKTKRALEPSPELNEEEEVNLC
eukprot:maker-scaffold_6-snap-gene-10.5-mRNA-1 protein AED:0.05 eAED:0.05 QI:96/1/1/1/0.66/0.5/4/933/309